MDMKAEFISEAIEVADIDPSSMSFGEPGIPRSFKWRGQSFGVKEVIRTWKETSGCSHGSKEAYVRKHWMELETSDGQRMKVYFERQSRRGGNAKKRWWLYSVG
jgi:phosphoribosylglycinamide formyltransferase-1